MEHNGFIVLFKTIEIVVETQLKLFEQLNRRFDERAAAKEPTELFTKNIGLC